jgi:hypothetical protein
MASIAVAIKQKLIKLPHTVIPISSGGDANRKQFVIRDERRFRLRAYYVEDIILARRCSAVMQLWLGQPPKYHQSSPPYLGEKSVD